MLTEQNTTTARVNHRGEERARSRKSRAAIAAGLVVVVTLTVAAIGVEALNTPDADNPIVTRSTSIVDNAPAGEPNYALLEEYLSRTSVGAGFVAPDGPPFGLDLGQPPEQTVTEASVFDGPTWNPNQGRLESILNPQQPSGPR